MLVALTALAVSGACTTDGASDNAAPSTSAAPGGSREPGPRRPSCLEPAQGRYAEADGPGGPTPVLLLGSGTRGVVVGAQANGGLCQTLKFGTELASQGYHVAIFSWTMPYAEVMKTATRHLIADGAQKVVLGGFSRGALVGLGTAPSLGPQIVGVFSVSGGPSASEGFPTVASLSAYQGPILLIWGQDDMVFPADTNDSIAAAHDGPETLLKVPGSGHALSLLNGNDGTAVRSAIDKFLAETLR